MQDVVGEYRTGGGLEEERSRYLAGQIHVETSHLAGNFELNFFY